MPDERPFNLNDPSSYARAIGRLLRNYSYTVEVTYTSAISGRNSQFITVSSNEILPEEHILTIAESYARGRGKSGVGGEIDSIDITEAQRSKELGEI